MEQVIIYLHVTSTGLYFLVQTNKVRWSPALPPFSRSLLRSRCVRLVSCYALPAVVLGSLSSLLSVAWLLLYDKRAGGVRDKRACMCACMVVKVVVVHLVFVFCSRQNVHCFFCAEQRSGDNTQ